MPSKPNNQSTEDAQEIFRGQGGMLRTSQALALGIHPRTLYEMRDNGVLERLERGLYRLGDMQPLSDPDLVTVARKIPNGVICLISALHFHDLTSQIPHRVNVAIERGNQQPRIKHPPIKIYPFSRAAFTEGIETHTVDNTSVQIYSPEKTIADSFKYRNKIGQDTVLEALDLYKSNYRLRPRELMKYAKVCRVEKVMRPYLEVIL